MTVIKVVSSRDGSSAVMQPVLWGDIPKVAAFQHHAIQLSYGTGPNQLCAEYARFMTPELIEQQWQAHCALGPQAAAWMVVDQKNGECVGIVRAQASCSLSCQDPNGQKLDLSEHAWLAAIYAPGFGGLLIEQVKEHAAAFWENPSMVSAVDPMNIPGQSFQTRNDGMLLYETPCSVTYSNHQGGALTKPALIFQHRLALLEKAAPTKEAEQNAIILLHPHIIADALAHAHARSP
jgi:hypothetical protein